MNKVNILNPNQPATKEIYQLMLNTSTNPSSPKLQWWNGQDWKDLDSSQQGGVTSVNGKDGDVVLNASDINSYTKEESNNNFAPNGFGLGTTATLIDYLTNPIELSNLMTGFYRVVNHPEMPDLTWWYVIPFVHNELGEYTRVIALNYSNSDSSKNGRLFTRIKNEDIWDVWQEKASQTSGTWVPTFANTNSTFEVIEGQYVKTGKIKTAFLPPEMLAVDTEIKLNLIYLTN